jgi:SAM-dependent methyltransferase
MALMTPTLRQTTVLTLFVLAFSAAAAAQHATTPAGAAGEQHSGGMKHDGPDHLAHRFDNPEDFARRFDDPARDAWQMPERVIDALQLKTGDVVADIGSGTGYFTVRLARAPAKPQVYAVDIEPAMRDYVTRRAAREGLTNVTAVLAGTDRTNLPEKVDVALLVDTFHHIPNRVAWFNALKARLKPGARVAIIDFRKDAPDGPPAEFRFSPEQISAELAEAGFVLQNAHDFLPRQLFLVYGLK